MRLSALFPVFATLLLGGCGPTHTPTPVRDIAANHDAFSRKEVWVRGEVKDAVIIPVVRAKLYSVDDGTGRMVVITRGELPEVKQRLEVRGTVEPPNVVNGIPVRLRMVEAERRLIN